MTDGARGSVAALDQWLSAHPRELVLLDWHHFYNYNAALHATTIQRVKATLGAKLCPVVPIAQVGLL